MYEVFLERFWNTYEHLLEEPRTHQNLAAIAKDLCKNTMENSTNGLAVPDSSEAFIDSFTGIKSRWDMLGSLVIVFGFGAVSPYPHLAGLGSLPRRNVLLICVTGLLTNN